jgi:hypothetical protein
MTILAGGGEMGAFIPSDSSIIESTSSGYFDSSFARCALNCSGSASYADGFEFAATGDTWTHFEVIQNTASASGSQATLCTWLDASANELFRLTSTTPFTGQTMTIQLQYNNASVWTNLGSSFTVTSALLTLDVNLVSNSASGSGTVYLSGTQRSTGTANLSALAGVAQFRGNGKTVAIPATVSLSQVIIADESTIGWRLKTVPATGAGATTDWTGTYTEIDEIVYSDADFINSATVDQVELFSHGTTVPSGYTVRGVIVTARAKRGSASGPQNLQLALRSGGTTYFSSSQALGLGYGAHSKVWEQDPATTADFTASAISTLQFGVKSIT